MKVNTELTRLGDSHAAVLLDTLHGYVFPTLTERHVTIRAAHLVLEADETPATRLEASHKLVGSGIPAVSGRVGVAIPRREVGRRDDEESVVIDANIILILLAHAVLVVSANCKDILGREEGYVLATLNPPLAGGSFYLGAGGLWFGRWIHTCLELWLQEKVAESGDSECEDNGQDTKPPNPPLKSRCFLLLSGKLVGQLC